ncbi:AGE family epimerase/isomerase [Roseateles violae]|uniref:AGE family epimerase/isomerase n=1 Tax=Roseateles violae TaxID=3058042 RepID=A0ABT8DL08_9BURK|nr:AGE family epimerase/isomerase [Pelomonas sp. PFR6]MDN3919100.1 AGE family epimerase/isomerase [Pelomonas sp. PFR6]
MRAARRLARSAGAAALALLLSLPLAGCDPKAKTAQTIDAQWHRQALLDGHLSKWLALAPTPSGMFLTAFDRDWRPRPNQAAVELTLQARLVYAMAIGYELSRDRRYLEAATRGGDFLLEHFHDPVNGGFFHVVAADGKLVADIKRTYGQAFALYALSHLYRVTQDERYRKAALRSWQEIAAGLRAPNGGFVNEATRNFSPMTGARTQNPLMHLFEALLALHEATGDAAALAGAKQLGDFVVYKLLQGRPDGGAMIAEWYDASWVPLPTREAGGYVDLGHQFEWSHLLQTAARQGVSPLYGPVAERLLQYALQKGYDDVDGGAFNRADPDGERVVREKFAWQQAECLHAMIVGAQTTGRNDLLRRYEQTLALIRNELIDPRGGWKGGALQTCQRISCGDEQLDPYHMTSMHRAAIEAGR